MKKIILFFSILTAVGLTALQAQDIWTQKADFGGTGRYGDVGFSIGDKGYIGTGYDGTYRRDFWEYNPNANVWTQKADFAGIKRVEAVGFCIGDKGYVGIGVDGSSFPYIYPVDFWEFDPAANTWTQKSDFTGQGRQSATGFAVGGKGYIGTGVDKLSGDNFYKDFYMYDPANDNWTKQADFGGGYRSNPRAFAIGDKGYIGTGFYGGWKKDLWEYNPATDAWAKKADFGGISREWAVAFSIGNKGYLGTGFYNYTWLADFWEYDPAANAWTQRADIAGPDRAHAVGFSIGDKGYIGTGEHPGSSPLKDFWEYTPEGCYGLTVYADADADNFGDASNSLFVEDCVIPSGYVIDYADCNDASASINPGETEILNGIDDNCNGEIDEGYSPDMWTQVADFGGLARYSAVAFSIGNKGYVGTGGDASGYRKDFWQYDPITNVWSQKADFGGGIRAWAVGVAIGDLGYVGTGWDGNSQHSYGSDFWEYNPVTNTWIQKSDFAGGTRSGLSGFAIGSKGYFGTGEAGGLGGTRTKDLWEYDPLLNSWTKKSDYGGNQLKHPAVFSVGGKGYFVTGNTNSQQFIKESWEYDPSTDTWTKKTDFPGTARYGAVGFSIGNSGFLSTGYSGSYLKDLWEYDPATDTWMQKSELAGQSRYNAVAFGIDNKAYVGTGSGVSSILKDFWQYTSETTTSCTVPTDETTTNITGTSALVNWDLESAAKGYKIEYEMTDGSGPVKTTFEKTGSKVISNLKPNTQYSWRVKSVCSLDPKLTSNWSAKQFFTTGTLKMGDEATTALAVYPNPVVETFTLHLQLQSSSVQSATIYLLNTLGQIVYNEKTTVENGLLLKEIKLNEHPTGMYLVKVIVNDQVYSASINYQK